MNKPKINYHNFVICSSHRSVVSGSGLLGCGIKVLDEWLKTFQMNGKRQSTTNTTVHPRSPSPTTFFLMALLTAIVFREDSSILCRLNKQDISNCNTDSKSLVQ